MIARLLIALILKPALILGIGIVFARVIGHRGAAARHAVWTGAVIACLALPFLEHILPPLRISTHRIAVLDALTTSGASGPARAAQGSPQRQAGPRPLDAPEPRHGRVELERLLFVTWAAIAFLLVCRRLAAEQAVRQLVRRGRRASADLSSLCDTLGSDAGIAKPVPLIVSDEIATPAAAGLIRQVVILPSQADAWTRPHVSAVLVHELAHVARRDPLANVIADVAAAIYWCNPCVWLAARRVRAESEHACDDVVIMGDVVERDTYVNLLLAIAKDAQVGPSLSRAFSAIARPSNLESRLLAVLDLRVGRRPLRRRMALALAGVSAIASVPIATVTLHAANVPGLLSPEPDQGQDSLTSPESERIPIAVNEDDLREAGRRALRGPDSTLAALLISATLRAPMHEGDLVRDRSEWALLQTRGDQLVAPIVDALGASDWRVQAYAAWTLAWAGDSQVVPELIPLLRHPVWRLRAMTAFTLRQLGDTRATEALTAALDDPAWQVRVEAVEFLARHGEQSSIELVRARLADRHVAVRAAAARAIYP